MQAASFQILAGVVVAILSTGLVEMELPMRLGAVLVYLERVDTRLA